MFSAVRFLFIHMSGFGHKGHLLSYRSCCSGFDHLLYTLKSIFWPANELRSTCLLVKIYILQTKLQLAKPKIWSQFYIKNNQIRCKSPNLATLSLTIFFFFFFFFFTIDFELFTFRFSDLFRSKRELLFVWQHFYHFYKTATTFRRDKI